jgi:hypothetical protein
VRVVADKRRGRAGASGEKEGEWDGGTTPDEGTRHGYSSWREVLRAPAVSNVENYLSLDDAPFRPWRSPPFPRAHEAPLCSRFISRGRAQVATDRVFIGARAHRRVKLLENHGNVIRENTRCGRYYRHHRRSWMTSIHARNDNFLGKIRPLED